MTKTERFKRLRLMMCCCGCGRPPPSDVAHSNASIHGKGMGIKSADEFTIPLNRVCHQKLDQYNMGMNREQSLEWFMQKWRETNRLLKWQERKVEQNGVDY